MHVDNSDNNSWSTSARPLRVLCASSTCVRWPGSERLTLFV